MQRAHIRLHIFHKMLYTKEDFSTCNMIIRMYTSLKKIGVYLAHIFVVYNARENINIHRAHIQYIISSLLAHRKPQFPQITRMKTDSCDCTPSTTAQWNSWVAGYAAFGGM